MASCITMVTSINPQAEGTAMYLSVIFTGTDVPNGPMQGEVLVEFVGGDTLAALKTKASTAISAKATEFGFTCLPTNMILPSFQKG